MLPQYPDVPGACALYQLPSLRGVTAGSETVAPMRRGLSRLPRMAVTGLALLVSACAGTTPDSAGVSRTLPAEAEFNSPLPPAARFSGGPVEPARRSNAQMARDFLDLEFQMESGRRVERLTRFEGPVTVVMTGDVPPSAAADLDLLIARLRHEAGIDISRVGSGPASITVEFRPKAQLQRFVPTAACYVVPNVRGLADYRAKRGSAAVDWTRMEERTSATVFVPSDTSPQEVRDCLHEETAQALGPLNDLYRLPDSVYNDDNFHTVLTGFDMLMLKVHYAPDLRNGMSEAEVAAVLPGVLSRANPAGGAVGSIPAGSVTPREWAQAIETAFGSRAALDERQAAARRAVAIGQAQGWRDTRMAFAWFALGRLTTGTDPDLSADAFRSAKAIYAGLPGCSVHAAHADMQIAAFDLSRGRFQEALALADGAIPAVRTAQNAALLATLLQIRAEALDGMGRTVEAQAARAESLGWARYGFGSDVEVMARMADIAALAAAGRRG